MFRRYSTLIIDNEIEMANKGCPRICLNASCPLLRGIYIEQLCNIFSAASKKHLIRAKFKRLRSTDPINNDKI